MEQQHAIFLHGPAALNELADAARSLVASLRECCSSLLTASVQGRKCCFAKRSALRSSPDGINQASYCQDPLGVFTLPLVAVTASDLCRSWQLETGCIDWWWGRDFLTTAAVTGALDVHTAGSSEIKPFWEVATPYPLYTENVLLLFESTFVFLLDYKHGDCSIRRHHGA